MTGFDYADQRFYTSGQGRFLSPDPSSGVHLVDPLSWNRYAYVGGDPVNFNDLEGLQKMAIDWTGGLEGRIGLLGGGFGPSNAPLAARTRGEWASPVAKEAQGYVASGQMTDCEALAFFVDTEYDQLTDTENGGSLSDQTSAKLIEAFGALTPNRADTSVAATAGVASTTKPAFTLLNPGVSDSGFKEDYQDMLGPRADQAHHFAGFIQIGFRLGAGFGSWFASVYEMAEGTPNNPGDINLGRLAAKWGAALADRSLQPGELGKKIRDELCKK